MARPATDAGTSEAEIRWDDAPNLSSTGASCSNHHTDSAVSTRPLSGIGVGSTWSYAEMRSLATTSSSPSGPAYMSRTLPAARCSGAVTPAVCHAAGAGSPAAMADQNELSSNPEKDPEDWTTGDEPMTGPQRSYLQTLAREAGEEVPADLTKAQASELIDRLQQATGRGA